MEGVPVALMEAMASGVITISSRHSGIPELIDHGVSGFLVNERDSVGLAKVIDEIASGVYNLTEIAANARLKIEARFNSRIEAVCLLDELTGICNGNHVFAQSDDGATRIKVHQSGELSRLSQTDT
jgi:colanic acid/amylovoran biosynthesis glycosyltransferase